MQIPCLSIGNDIVDLRTSEPALHARYVSRVFTPREQALMRGAGTVGLWLTWAAKEAAYKAAKRLDPSVVFSPVEFEFDIKESVVTYGNHRLPCHQVIEKDYVAVHCATSRSILQSMHHWIAKDKAEFYCLTASANLSEAVRRFGARRIGQLLGIKSERLSFSKPTTTISGVRSIPTLSICGELSRHLISFSHHGRFIACSFMHAESLWASC